MLKAPLNPNQPTRSLKYAGFNIIHSNHLTSNLRHDVITCQRSNVPLKLNQSTNLWFISIVPDMCYVFHKFLQCQLLLLLARLMNQYCFACWRLSSSSVTLLPGTWAVERPAGGCGRPTLHGGPVWLHPVRATPCFHSVTTCAFRA